MLVSSPRGAKIATPLQDDHWLQTCQWCENHGHIVWHLWFFLVGKTLVIFWCLDNLKTSTNLYRLRVFLTPNPFEHLFYTVCRQIRAFWGKKTLWNHLIITRQTTPLEGCSWKIRAFKALRALSIKINKILLWNNWISDGERLDWGAGWLIMKHLSTSPINKPNKTNQANQTKQSDK